MRLIRLAGFLWLTAGCAGNDVPSYYRKTRHEPGHDLVKTEQFVIPVGAVAAIERIQMTPPACRPTERQDSVIRQVFNSLEELTEGILNDPDSARVAEFRGMRFAVGGDCSQAVMAKLAALGTPAWRLEGHASRGPVTIRRIR